jgi:esterase/lipase
MDKSKIHFVLVAGFSSDHLEAMGLKKSLEKKGFSADAISFYGDGYIDDFTDLKISDCIANIAEFINGRAGQYETVFGIGISLGGALLLEHAKSYNNLKGIASIGTPLKLKNRVLISFGQKILPFVYFFWRRMQKIKRLRLNPLGATNMMIEYLETGLPKNLDYIKTPVLLLHSKKDPVSDYRVLPKYLNLISSKKKRITFFDNGNHVIDHDPDLVVKYALDFLEINVRK